jgi:hypothetical protein
MYKHEVVHWTCPKMTYLLRVVSLRTSVFTWSWCATVSVNLQCCLCHVMPLPATASMSPTADKLHPPTGMSFNTLPVEVMHYWLNLYAVSPSCFLSFFKWPAQIRLTFIWVETHGRDKRNYAGKGWVSTLASIRSPLQYDRKSTYLIVFVVITAWLLRGTGHREVPYNRTFST